MAQRLKHARHWESDGRGGHRKWDHSSHGAAGIDEIEHHVGHEFSRLGPHHVRRDLDIDPATGRGTRTDRIAPLEHLAHSGTRGIRMRCALRLNLETEPVGAPWYQYVFALVPQTDAGDLAAVILNGLPPLSQFYPIRPAAISSDFARYYPQYSEYRISRTWFRWRAPATESLGQAISPSGGEIGDTIWTNGRCVMAVQRGDVRINPSAGFMLTQNESYITSRSSAKVEPTYALVASQKAMYQECHYDGIYDDVWFPTGYYLNTTQAHVGTYVYARINAGGTWTATTQPANAGYHWNVPGPWFQMFALDFKPPGAVLSPGVLLAFADNTQTMNMGFLDVGFDLEFRKPVPLAATISTVDRHGSQYDMFIALRESIRRLEESGIPRYLLVQLPIWAIWQDLQASASDFAHLEQQDLEAELDDFADLEVVTSQAPETPGVPPPSPSYRMEIATPRLVRSDAQAGLPRTRTLGTTRRG